MLDHGVGKRMVRLVRAVGPLPKLGRLDQEKMLGLLIRDKKAVGGKIHWVLPVGIGKIKVTPDVPSRLVAQAFHDVSRGVWNG